MRIYWIASRVAALLIFASTILTISLPSPTLAAAKDYLFELVNAQPAGPGKTAVTVRLVHVPDKKPVEGAVLFDAKADMTPGGMADFTGKVSPLPSDQPGLYRFQIETGMTGKWRLLLGAKVQGENETVRGTVDYEAAK